MAEFVEVIRQKAKMCETYLYCQGCPIDEMLGFSVTLDCRTFEKNFPKDFERIVMEWEPAPLKKSMTDLLLEHFPYAPLNDDGSPKACVAALGFGDCPAQDGKCYYDCRRCWNRPAPEE